MSTEEMSIKSGSAGTATSELTLAQRLEESARLSRFFSKLLGEALHLHADSILFSASKDSMAVTMRQAKSDLKSISIKPSWFNPMCTWLADRFLVVSDEPRSANWVIDREHATYDFVSCVRVSDEIASLLVKTNRTTAGTQTLTLTILNTMPRARALDKLAMSLATRLLFDKLLSSENGIIVLASPDSDQLQKNRAAMLSLTNLNYGGDVAESSIRADIPQLSRAEVILISARADDATDALLKLKEFGVDVRATNVQGALCQGFVRKTCPACARKASVDKKLLAMLPATLSSVSFDGYVVGRGCESCGQRGQLGVIGVQSITCVDDSIRTLLNTGADQENLLKVAYSAGTRSLYEDGLAKVVSGTVTLEALNELTKFLPAAYNSFVGNQQQGRKESGSAATTAATGPVDGDAPLFSLGPTGKQRAKPLVLVVEDDPDQRAILDMVFKASNYEVVLSANGKEALEQLKSNLPDLIISDLMMPQMDGAELVAKLKADTVLRKIPVLILTVVTDGDKEYALLDLGADDYCEKTVQRKILLKRVENLIKRSRAVS